MPRKLYINKLKKSNSNPGCTMLMESGYPQDYFLLFVHLKFCKWVKFYSLLIFYAHLPEWKTFLDWQYKQFNSFEKMSKHNFDQMRKPFHAFSQMNISVFLNCNIDFKCENKSTIDELETSFNFCFCHWWSPTFSNHISQFSNLIDHVERKPWRSENLEVRDTNELKLMLIFKSSFALLIISSALEFLWKL